VYVEDVLGGDTNDSSVRRVGGTEKRDILNTSEIQRLLPKLIHNKIELL
jgi:hypothetical protein